jgi:hypothetical protein
MSHQQLHASAPASSAPPVSPLQFVLGEDGRWRGGAYVLGPGRAGFSIPIVDIFREGIHAHRTVGQRSLEDAKGWARGDAVRLGIEDMGQRSLL